MREIIEAGAGCGKTYGLVTRYLAALGVNRGETRKYRSVLPSKILTLTFTNDAADEMRSRISAALLEKNRRDLAEQVKEQGYISTFHSFCYSIVKPHFMDLGYSDSEVLSAIESQTHKMRHVLATLATSPLSEDVQKLCDLKRLYHFCAANWRRPRREIEDEILETYQNVSSATEGWIVETIALFRDASEQRPDFFENAEAWPYQVYEFLNDRNWEGLKQVAFNKGIKKWWAESFPELKIRAEIIRDFAKKDLHQYLKSEVYRSEVAAFQILFDFLEELQANAPKLLDFDALEIETLNFLHASPEKAPKYDLIIVDEFQDTNKRQVEIVDLLCHDKTELYFVGDPKQAIYSFRGGDSRVFEDQKQKLELSSLDINRRSLPNALNFMNELTTRTFTSEEDPHAQILSACDEKINEANSHLSNVVITLSAKKEDDAFWDGLAADLRAQSDYSSKAILCQQWSKAFKAFEELSRRGINVELGNDLDLSKHHLSALWISFLKTQDGTPEAIEHWNHLSDTWDLGPLEIEDQKKEQDPRAWLRLFVNAVSPQRWPQGLVWLATIEAWIQNHSAQLRWIPTASQLASAFQKSMNLRLTLDNPVNLLSAEVSSGKTVITTIHKSKGLQYESVFLFDLFEGTRRGSHQSVADADDEESLESIPIRGPGGVPLKPLYFRYKKLIGDQKVLAEKKRLFYVAYTRAERHLYFYLNSDNKPARETHSLESALWGWPSLDGLSWESTILSAANENPQNLTVEIREAPAEPVTETSLESIDEWVLPTPRPNVLPVPAKEFWRSGTRTYIDEVLFKDAEPLYKDVIAPAQNEVVDPTTSMALGSALHKILESWDGDVAQIDDHLQSALEVQRPKLRRALTSLASFADLGPLWADAQSHPERVQRELGLFVHGDGYRLSGFADLVWFRDAETAIVLDWKSSSTTRAALNPIKVAKTEAQVRLYAQSLAPLIKNVEIWSLAVVFEPDPQLQWLFKKPL